MAMKRKVATPRDPKKDSIINLLSLSLTDGGYTVRREKLKQGFGWKVLSGQCKVDNEEFIFVDRRLSQDDQIDFLIHKINLLSVHLPKEKLTEIPEKLVKKIHCFDNSESMFAI